MIGYGTGWMRMTTVLQAFLLIKTVHGLCITGCGQLPVTQTFTGGIPNPLVILGSGNECYIIAGTQAGSVQVSGGARLIVESTTISGSIEASGALTSVSLMSATVTGDVIMSNGAGALCVDDDTKTEDLKVEDSGSVRVEGTVSSVEVALSTGDIELVGATVLGGVSVVQTTGDLVINSQSSVIGGSIEVDGGTGSVTVSNVNLIQVDLHVVEQDGDVSVESASLIDILIEQSTATGATISLEHVTIGGDTELNDNPGANVFLADCTFGGDTLIARNGDVHIEDSNFSGENLSILQNKAVTVTSILDFSGSISENSGVVEITSNVFSTLSVNDNAGVVAIASNTGQTLSCSGNNQPVAGGGNTITSLSCPPL